MFNFDKHRIDGLNKQNIGQLGFVELTLEVTQLCGLACKHCSSSSTKATKTSLPRGVVEIIIADAAALGVQHVAISGGEPLTYPDLRFILRLLTDHGIKTTVYSSGTTLDGSTIVPLQIDILHDLASYDNVTIALSVYSHRAMIHNSITGISSFHLTLETLQRCSLVGLPILLHCVPMRPNFRDLKGLHAIAADHNCLGIKLLRFVPQGRAAYQKEILELTSSDIQELVEIIHSLPPTPPIFLGSPWNGLLKNSQTQCSAGSSRASIRYDGSILPCEALKFLPVSAFSNIKDTLLRNALEDFAQIREIHPGQACIAQELLNPHFGGTLQFVPLDTLVN